MLKELSAVRVMEIECSQEEALPFIWDIRNIEYCEVKADKVQVTKDTPRTGTYTVHGHFARFIPWSRTFSYQLHATGFHSKEAQVPPSILDIQGGFFVEATSERSCKIVHYEQYKLPLRFLVLRPFILAYLRWSQKKEMKDLKALILKNMPGAANLASTNI